MIFSKFVLDKTTNVMWKRNFIEIIWIFWLISEKPSLDYILTYHYDIIHWSRAVYVTK